MAVWQQKDGQSARIFASRYSASSGKWTKSTKIESGSGEASSPQVGMDDNGNALVVWLHTGTARSAIWSNAMSGTSGVWGKALQVKTPAGSVSKPALAINGNGQAMVAWSHHTNTSAGILVSHYKTNKWDPYVYASNAATKCGDPQIGMDGSGNAAVVWGEKTPKEISVQASRYDAMSGKWLKQRQLDRLATKSATAIIGLTRVAMHKNGNSVALWTIVPGYPQASYALYARFQPGL